MPSFSQNPLISIIVPVYNEEKYLARCVDSLVKQNYKNIEIILVDDGSTDSSPLICDCFHNKYTFIKVIHQKNQGLSVARNTGVLNSHGSIITFIDSDDYLNPSTLIEAVNYFNKYSPDMVCFNIRVCSNTRTISYFNDNLNQLMILNRQEALKYHVIQENKYISTSACGKFYKRFLLEKIPFEAGIYYEDLNNIYRWINICKIIVYSSKPFYNYFYNENSITHGQFNDKWFTWLDINNKRIEFYEKNSPENLKYLYATYIDNALSLIYKSRKQKGDILVKRNELIYNLNALLKNKPEIALNIKIRTKLYTYKMSKILFYWLMYVVETSKRRKRKNG